MGEVTEMGKISVRENKSVYQLAREELGYSRAEASDLMAGIVPEHRLVKIEDGSCATQPEDVCAMAEAYNKPELRNHYCAVECPIGKMDVPEITFKNNIHEILVNMVVSLESVNAKKGRLMQILSNGVINEGEEHDFNAIQAELDKISATVVALHLWCEKMKGNEDE